MNQKAFAIFVGVIMVLSAFASFVLMGGDNSGSGSQGTAASADATPASQFGVGGTLVDSSFSGLGDMLSMIPENTTFAYWLDMDRSDNLTSAARAAIPQSYQSYGLYSGNLYSTKIERLGAAFMNDSSFAEFHWITPYRLSYSGFTVPYQDYQLIPIGSGVFAAMGKPVVFGTQSSVETIVDVLSGTPSTDKITLPLGEYADFQVAGLGHVSNLGPTASAPLGGGYSEFYLGVNQKNSTYSMSATYLDPDTVTDQRIKDIAGKYGLAASSKPGEASISGEVTEAVMGNALKAFLAP
ncbi:MAG TPA: hypothetical protein VN455_00850 [Methanotrichaceae archaeon]|nr:hypothetical protein [Methanotrichaceae archaeon]